MLVDAGLAQELQERVIGPGGHADAKPFDGGEVAAPRRKIRTQNEQPRRALRQRHDELRSLPVRKPEQHRVSAARDEVDRAVAQRRHGLERGQELDVRVAAFFAEEPELSPPAGDLETEARALRRRGPGSRSS